MDRQSAIRSAIDAAKGGEERTREVSIIPREMTVKYPVVCRKKSSGRRITIFVKSWARLSCTENGRLSWLSYLCAGSVGRPLFGKANDDVER
jgi:hypothetical protein